MKAGRKGAKRRSDFEISVKVEVKIKGWGKQSEEDENRIRKNMTYCSC